MAAINLERQKLKHASIFQVSSLFLVSISHDIIGNYKHMNIQAKGDVDAIKERKS